MPVDFATLTAAQQVALLTADSLEVDAGCELLNFDLTFNTDLTDSLDTSQGDVAWDGSKTIHRDCSITLTVELAWGIALVRIFQVLTDTVTGLSARRNLGVFCLTAPDEPLGQTVTDEAGVEQTAFTVTGQDRLYLLDRQVGASYVVASGTAVLTALAAVFTAAGLTGVLVDSSAAGKTVPTDMAWPLVPTTTASTDVAPFAQPTDATQTNSGPTTWLDIVNDLLALISYRGVWCDENGMFRCVPYADPAARAPSFTFDADDEDSSTVAVSRMVTQDLWSAPNRWIFLWSNMPLDGSGNEQTPTVANGGVYVVNNVSDGPSSQSARNGLIWPAQISYTAAAAADLVAQGDARVAADKRVVTTYTVSTAPFPIASHFDVFTYNDSAIGGGTAKVQATSWQVPLNGGNVSWSWEKVG